MAVYLADTNVLLRSVDPASQLHTVATAAIEALLRGGDEICLTAQNFVEFWAVVTRPSDANGLGWCVEKTSSEVRALRAQFRLLEETPNVFPTWLELVSKYQLCGKRVHDARLVAVMKVHGVSRFLTFNEEHFRCFTEIELLRPSTLTQSTIEDHSS